MDIYQHFRKEEQPFIDQILSYKEQVERTYLFKLTDFLDPRERQIVTQIIGEQNEELKLYTFGGSEHVERQRMIIAPLYDEIKEEDFQVSLLEATYQEKFISLEHRDVMGAFMSLGLKREKLGDIFVEDGKIQIISAEEIALFVIMNLTSIKNAKVNLLEKNADEFVVKPPHWLTKSQTVASVRLDAVLKEIYRVSRKDAQEAIGSKLVKVNHRVVEDVKYPLEEGDLLSLRGKGRSKLISIDHKTRKDKWRITTAILK